MTFYMRFLILRTYAFQPTRWANFAHQNANQVQNLNIPIKLCYIKGDSPLVFEGNKVYLAMDWRNDPRVEDSVVVTPKNTMVTWLFLRTSLNLPLGALPSCVIRPSWAASVVQLVRAHLPRIQCHGFQGSSHILESGFNCFWMFEYSQ